MSSREQIILDVIKEALGDSADNFIIEKIDTLVDEDECLSLLVSFQPNLQMDPTEGRIEAEKQSFEFNLFLDGEVSLIVGEDTPIEVTSGNLFTCLYWGEVIKAA